MRDVLVARRSSGSRAGSAPAGWCATSPRRSRSVNADPGLLEQAVVNILENAIAYSPDGTADRGRRLRGPDECGDLHRGRGPRHSHGRPRADLREVPPARAALPTGGKGAGLGLSIAKGFVEAMGGRIAAASPMTATSGTRVLISLPKPAPTHRVPALIRQPPQHPRRRRRAPDPPLPRPRARGGRLRAGAGRHRRPMRCARSPGARPTRWCSTSACPTSTARRS